MDRCTGSCLAGPGLLQILQTLFGSFKMLQGTSPLGPDLATGFLHIISYYILRFLDLIEEIPDNVCIDVIAMSRSSEVGKQQ
jgi:hypothetical protein